MLQVNGFLFIKSQTEKCLRATKFHHNKLLSIGLCRFVVVFKSTKIHKTKLTRSWVRNRRKGCSILIQVQFNEVIYDWQLKGAEKV